jgi:uncharacterized damage-inducible protein DinB
MRQAERLSVSEAEALLSPVLALGKGDRIMRADSKALEKLARRALSGKDAHVATKEVFSGLDWQAAGSKPRSVPHSLYQLLKHMSYWQDWVVQWLAGKNPGVPRHASGSWPAEARPSSRRDWDEAVRQFRHGLVELERGCRGADLSSGRGRKSRLEMLHAVGAHNSYHSGQVALLRQLLGTWPPPSGGLTW